MVIDTTGSPLLSVANSFMLLYNRMFIPAGGGGAAAVNGNRTGALSCEAYQAVHANQSSGPIVNGDQVALRTVRGNYITAENGGGGKVDATRTKIGPWETFTVEVVQVNPQTGPDAKLKQFIALPAFDMPNADWTTLEQSTPVAQIVVSSFDDATAQRVTQAKNAGLTFLGYTNTLSGNRPINDVKTDINKWYNLARIDGIFLDEGPDPLVQTTVNIQTYYGDLHNYVKNQSSKGGTRVMLNAYGILNGTFPQIETYEWVMQTTDIALLWEQTAAVYFNQFRMPRWSTKYPPQRIAHTVHNCVQNDLAGVVAWSKQHRAGYIYVFDGSSNAYNHLPSYWQLELSKL